MMMKIKKLSMINDHEDYDILNAITDIKVQSRINGYQRVKRNGQVPVPSVLHASKAPPIRQLPARSWSRRRRSYQCKFDIILMLLLKVLLLQDTPALINEDSNSNSASKAMEWGDYYMNEEDYAMQVGAGFRVRSFFFFSFLLLLQDSQAEEGGGFIYGLRFYLGGPFRARE